MIDLYELAAADPELRFSPYCWRIRMALAHKGLHARLLPWHFGDRRLPGGNSAVPVLVDDGEVIADSTDIAFHLEDKYDHGPSLFGGETGEAHARFIIAWTDTVLQPAILPFIAADVVALVKPDARATFRETREKRLGTTLEKAAANRAQAVTGLRNLLHPLRKVIETEAYLGGEEPSYADYTVFGAFQWARCVSTFELLSEDDPVHAWRERILELFDGMAADAKTIAKPAD
jgi:glutathione S-transferase